MSLSTSVYTKNSPPPGLTPAQLITWDRQETFLHAFSTSGTILNAARTAGIHRDTAHKWAERDTLEFKRRLENARADFSESVEDIIFTRIQDPKCNPLLLMFVAKAHNRAKYGDQVTVTNDHAVELLGAVRAPPSADAVVEGEIIRDGREEVERALGQG